MSTNWQESWHRAIQYWLRQWRQWVPLAAVLTAWLWAVFMAAPRLTPFILMEFQPINSKSIATTYQDNLTSLVHQLPVLATVFVLASLAGGIVVLRLLRARVKRQGMLPEVVGAAFMAALSLFAVALVRVPLGGQYLNPLGMLVRAVLILFVFVVLVPWLFWAGPLALNGRGSFWSQILHSPKDLLFLPWTWLIGVVVGELFSASLAWTTTLNPIGTLVLAFLLVGSGLLHQSVAYYYTLSFPSNWTLKKTS